MKRNRVLALLLVCFMLFSLLPFTAFAIVEHVHDYSIITVIRPQTCTRSGLIKLTCSCGAYKYEAIPAAHTWDDGVITTEPTCTEEGVNTFTCTVCGATKTEPIAATGHTPVDEIVTEATCGATGEKNVVCSVCGEVLK